MSRQRYNLSPAFTTLSRQFTHLVKNALVTSVDCQNAFKLTTKQAVWVASFDEENDHFWMVHTAWKCAYDRLPKGGRRKAHRNRKHAR